MALPNKMYPASNSRITILSRDVGASDTEMPVDDVSMFPPGPNYATIGMDNLAETIQYHSIDFEKMVLSGCVRGVSGTTSGVWKAGDSVYHALASENFNAVVDNVVHLSDALDHVQVEWDSVLQKPEAYPPAVHGHAAGEVRCQLPEKPELNVQTALDQLFTFANDGKSAVADAIGSPATHDDSFSALAETVDTAREQLGAFLERGGVIGEEDARDLLPMAERLAGLSIDRYPLPNPITTGMQFYSGVFQSFSTLSQTYVCARRYRMLLPGVFRFFYVLETPPGSTMNSQLWLNGAAYEAERLIDATKAATAPFVRYYSATLTLKPGDVVELYIKSNAAMKHAINTVFAVLAKAHPVAVWVEEPKS